MSCSCAKKLSRSHKDWPRPLPSAEFQRLRDIIDISLHGYDLEDSGYEAAENFLNMADNSVVEENLVGSGQNEGENGDDHVKLTRSESLDSPKSDDEGLGVEKKEVTDNNSDEVEEESPNPSSTLDAESPVPEAENSCERDEVDLEETGNDNENSNVELESENVEENLNESLNSDDRVEEEDEVNKQEESNEPNNLESSPTRKSSVSSRDSKEASDMEDNNVSNQSNEPIMASVNEGECEISQQEHIESLETTPNDEEEQSECDSRFTRELSCISEKEDEMNVEQITEAKDNAPADNEENVVEENITETLAENVESIMLNSTQEEDGKPVEETMNELNIEQVEAAMIHETCSENGDESTDVEVNLPIKYESDTQLQWAMEILLGKSLPVLDTSYRSIRNELESFYTPVKSYTIKRGQGIVEEPTEAIEEQVVQAEVNLGNESTPLNSNLDRNLNGDNGLLNNSGVDDLDDTILSDGSEGVKEREPLPEILSPKSPRKRFSLRHLLTCSRAADD
ncbi:DgyrCDS5210 [Dimorphilus gyrociliatus]|uniref:DgyrCDS5210 n=1 Tax=Dimorphilus gyrociliatus TaxID=2664684 RepID=A0A7I8VJ49_9ANNE|nr:DgyrCDS5210 [Dimorphilus gyrociliatus]